MKRFLVLFLPTFLLISCRASSTPAPTTTLIPSAATAPTLSSTVTPEPSPTAAKDPNAPQEYTGFENGNYYLDKKTDKGNTLTYIWDVERKSYYRPIFNGYLWDFSPEINEPDATGKDTWSDGFLTNVYIDGVIDGEQSLPTLTHHDNLESQSTINFTTYFQTLMFEQMAKKGLIKSKLDFDFVKWWIGDGYSINFTNADGQQHFAIRDESTITVYMRNDADTLKENMETNGFSEAKSYTQFGPENSYLVKIWTENGNLFVDIAPTLRPATEWTEKQIMEMIMFGFSAVFDQGPDLSNPQVGEMLSRLVLNQNQFKLIDYAPPQ